jgi:predicted enzyme related to lactoylglutathione lyase
MARLPGKLVWLEVNTPRAHAAQRFYSDMFCWRARPLHVEPMGLMPMFDNGGQPFANVFMALGAFAPSRWLSYFSADIDAAAARIADLGGRSGGKPETVPGWGRSLACHDPEGTSFTLFERHGGDPEDPSRPGDPHTCELWAASGEAMAGFYARLLGLSSRPGERGWALADDDGTARLHVRSHPFTPPAHRWIPYFRSRSVQADERRAMLLGALRQVPLESDPDLGDVVVMADPAGCLFGLVLPLDEHPGSGGGA